MIIAFRRMLSTPFILATICVCAYSLTQTTGSISLKVKAEQEGTGLTRSAISNETGALHRRESRRDWKTC